MAVGNMKLLVCLLLTTNLAYGLIRDDYGNLRPLKKWLPQYVELDNDKGMEMGISTSEGPTRVRLYPKQGFNNPEQVMNFILNIFYQSTFDNVILDCISGKSLPSSSTERRKNPTRF